MCECFPIKVTVKGEGSNDCEESTDILQINAEVDCNEGFNLQDSTLNTDQDGTNEPLPHMEQVKLAEDLRLLDDNKMGGVVDIILEHDALTVGEVRSVAGLCALTFLHSFRKKSLQILNDEEPEAIIKFKDLKPITLRKVATYVKSVLTSTSNRGTFCNALEFLHILSYSRFSVAFY
uniref:BTB domain-containing protein n=1 Tax=Angiostrongylus cantonensis TaxID=6313 RepID=A0A0K0CY29_ANGCA